MTRCIRHAIALAMGIAALATSLVARAEDQFKLLDDKQIRARLVGKDITDGPHWTMYLRPDGALVSSEGGDSWTGTWKIRSNRLCISNPASKALECNEVWMSGANIRMRASKDQETLDATVAAHRSN